MPEQDPPNVSDYFAGETNDHCCHVTPRLISDAKVDVHDEVDAEDGGVEGIAGQTCSVVEGSECQVACCETAQVLIH